MKKIFSILMILVVLATSFTFAAPDDYYAGTTERFMYDAFIVIEPDGTYKQDYRLTEGLDYTAKEVNLKPKAGAKAVTFNDINNLMLRTEAEVISVLKAKNAIQYTIINHPAKKLRVLTFRTINYGPEVEIFFDYTKKTVVGYSYVDAMVYDSRYQYEYYSGEMPEEGIEERDIYVNAWKKFIKGFCTQSLDSYVNEAHYLGWEDEFYPTDIPYSSYGVKGSRKAPLKDGTPVAKPFNVFSSMDYQYYMGTVTTVVSVQTFINYDTFVRYILIGEEGLGEQEDSMGLFRPSIECFSCPMYESCEGMNWLCETEEEANETSANFRKNSFSGK